MFDFEKLTVYAKARDYNKSVSYFLIKIKSAKNKNRLECFE